MSLTGDGTVKNGPRWILFARSNVLCSLGGRAPVMVHDYPDGNANGAFSNFARLPILDVLTISSG